MAEGKGYFSRSWALIGKEPGWYKVPLVMGIANFVPIAGPLGTSGYVFEWSRLIAWGADAAPQRPGLGGGVCHKSRPTASSRCSRGTSAASPGSRASAS